MPEKLFFKISKLTYLNRDELVDAVVKDRSKKILIALNSDKLILNETDQDFIDLCNDNICYFDGIGAAWAHNRKFKSGARKIAGIELYLDVLQELAKRKIPVALIGGSIELIEHASAALQRRIENLQVAAISDGYIDKLNWDSVILDFKKAGAGYVIAAMGSPLQEEFLIRSLKVAGVGGMGVGGSLKVLIGEQQRAPKAFRNVGLEFLYRYFRHGVKLHRIKADFVFFIRTLTGQY